METPINFNEKKGFICDMDGVIYHGNRILLGLEYYRVGDIWQFNSFAYYVRDKAILGEEIYSGIIS